MLSKLELEKIKNNFWIDATIRPPTRAFSIDPKGAIADRLRVAAFAEYQAIVGFQWACEEFKISAPNGLINRWQQLIPEEVKHLNWLFARALELNINFKEAPVSDSLLKALLQTKTATEFCVLMCDAEDRGRKAGFRFYDFLKKTDPVSAEIFQNIAIEEEKHIDVVLDFFPNEFSEFKALKTQRPTRELPTHLVQKP